ncbi:DASH complex subunit DAM1 [Nakaseomyces bracarensis]|uniref:DASH complex subunit DAM1 n=1 Tax=Nakaseomyces bracarensis TaxID=273131 RepID=A0ABR4NUI3_9SACH
MSQDKNGRSATEYKLSMSSNPGSRRSSMAGTDSFNEEVIGKNDVLKEYLLPQIRDLTDSVVTLDSNMTRLNYIHDNLVDLNESFGSLLYGIMCNSWCVEFPNAPHRFDREISTMKRVKELSLEKAKIQRLIEDLKNSNRNENSHNGSSYGVGGTAPKKEDHRSKFNTPMFPPSGLVRNRNTLNKENLTRFNRQNPVTHTNKEIDEETNSEASFVMNPIIQNKDTPAKDSDSKSRLRRKSILHTIRNSIASTSDAFNKRKDIPMGRVSLGGGATRVVNRNMFQQERANTRHSTTGVPNRGISKRPPFK